MFTKMISNKHDINLLKQVLKENRAKKFVSRKLVKKRKKEIGM